MPKRTTEDGARAALPALAGTIQLNKGERGHLARSFRRPAENILQHEVRTNSFGTTVA